MTLAAAVIGLILPVVLGLLCGVAGLFEDPDAAVNHLNRFALYVPFPALIVAALGKDSAPLPHSVAFWLLVPLTVGAALVPLKAVGDRLGGLGGTMALVTVFGNVAYLGLPFLQAVRGDAVMSTAGLLVGMYIFLSMLFGPLLLRVWSGEGGRDAFVTSARKVVRQPLAWSPIVGGLLRLLPDALRLGVVDAVMPVGRAAGPVALFLLGLYLHTHGRKLRQVDVALVAHLGVKMVWLPLVTGAGVWIGLRFGLDVEAARCALLLASMPPAITTFAIARDADIGADRVAQSIVAGTLLSAVTLPLTAAWVASW